MQKVNIFQLPPRCNPRSPHRRFCPRDLIYRFNLIDEIMEIVIRDFISRSRVLDPGRTAGEKGSRQSRRSPVAVPYQSGAGSSTAPSSRSHCIIGGFPLGREFCPGIEPIGGRDALRSACWVSRCLLRSTLRWKARPQSSQANGLKPVCFLECVIRLLLCENALPHT